MTHCPHCKAEIDCYEQWQDASNNAEFACECPACGRIVVIAVDMTPTFTITAPRSEINPPPEPVPRRYVCSRCGGYGKQPAGCWDGKAYAAPAGVCDTCGGTGELGEIKPSKGQGDANA